MADKFQIKNNIFDEMNKGFSLPKPVTLNIPVIKPDDKTSTLEEKNMTIALRPANSTSPLERIPSIDTVTPQQNNTKPSIQPHVNLNNEIQKTSNTTNQSDSTGKKKLGKIVLISMGIAGAAVLLLTKGLSGSTAGKIRRMADKWEDNFLRYACKNKAVGMVDEQIVKTSQTAKKIFGLSDAIANFTAIKDTLFHQFTSWNFLKIKGSKVFNFPKLHKFLNKFLPLQKVCDFCTKNILKITIKAVDSKYTKAASHLDLLEAYFRAKLKNAKDISPKDLAKITKQLDQIGKVYKKGFGKSARNQRLSDIHNGLKDLAESVKESLISPFSKSKKGISAKKAYTSYVTQTLSEPAHNLHRKAIASAKNAITNDIKDVYANMRTVANDLKHCFDPKDKESRLLFGELLDKMETYKLLSGSNEAVSRAKLQKEMLAQLQTISEKLPTATVSAKKGVSKIYSQKDIDKASELIDVLKNIINKSSKKGLLQNILSDIKPYISEKDYKLLNLRTQQFNYMLHDAIEAESNNMFNKIAESKVGSIPTDVLGLLTMAGTGAWAISKGKDKDEKVGATLKVGIPLLGSISAYFYTASKAFSGTANLAFGAATAFILNRIGDSVYKYYQKRFVENKSVKEIAKDAYNQATET